jgi:predicted transposase YdaD
MGLVRAILDASSLVREERASARVEGREEGRIEGRTEGRAEGRIEGKVEGEAAEARKLLRIALRTQYPDLLVMPEVDQITKVEALESMIEAVLCGSSQDTIRRTILAAAADQN